jgi:MFS transporter, DHA2 family, multidrug resistance protein
MSRRWAGLGVLSLSLLVVIMDMTILNVALPELAREVRPSSVELLWIVDVYSLVVGGLLVTASALGDRIGRRRLLIIGYSLFGLASLLVLWVDTPAGLIAVRALLGLGGAMIMPATLSMIRSLFTDTRERALALGLWAAVAGAGAALGPIVGGALLELFSWHAAFLVNVPLMVFAALAAAAILPESRPAQRGTIDAPGVVLSITGMAGVMYAIKHLGKDGLSLETLAAATVGVVALAWFVRRCLRSPAPMLDVRLLGLRDVRAGTLTALILMVATGGLLLLAAQWLQLVEGLSPLESGFALLPMSIAAIVVSLAVPGIAQRIGARRTLVSGLVIGGLGLLLPGVLPSPLGLAGLTVALAFAGVTMGTMSIVTSLIMSGTPNEKAGSAAAIEETSYEIGAAASVAILGSLATAIFRAGLPEGTSEAARESLASALSAGLGDVAAAAFTDALVWASVAGGIALLASAVVVARLLRPRRDFGAPQPKPSVQARADASSFTYL